MCELMALSFAKPIHADFSIHEFALRGSENADGWGLAWYPDRSLALVKEPIQWRASAHTNFLEKYAALLSPIFLAHVRHGTTGGAPTHADTHPFARELDGRDYCFAHNGTLEGFSNMPLGRFHPVGTTDSEHVFCHLLDLAGRQKDRLTEPSGWRWLHEQLIALNRMGRINCLLSDGERLFCYHDANTYKGLHFRKVVIRSHQVRRFEDASLGLQLAGDCVNHGFVIATQPLSSAGWHPFHGGELVVVQEGVIRFSSHRRETMERR